MPCSDGMTKAAAKREPPPVGLGNKTAEIDAKLQQSSLWQLVKREFKEWYAERLGEAEKLRADQKEDKDVSEFLMKQLIDLRRRNADAVLAASIFHFGEFTVRQAKEFMAGRNIEVRL